MMKEYKIKEIKKEEKVIEESMLVSQHSQMDYTLNVGRLVKNLPMNTNLETLFMLFSVDIFPISENGK